MNLIIRRLFHLSPTFPLGAEEFFDEADADTVATIKDLLETRVRPAVAVLVWEE